MYRAIEGIYLNPHFISREHRTKRNNLLPLALGPFGYDLADVFESLYHLCELDSGMELDISGEKIFICSFVSVRIPH